MELSAANEMQISRPAKELTMHELATYLYPIPRSLTGEGIRKSFEIFQEIHPEFKTYTFKTGEKVGDWEIPNEWNINSAYIELEDGSRICNFEDCNLSVVGYSRSINQIMSFKELKRHLYYREDLPNAIPYVTSYYKEDWGFCLPYNLYKSLDINQQYRCVIDSSLEPGNLELLEAEISSSLHSKDEIFFSSYLCHPSMANNELSGPVVLSKVLEYIKSLPTRNYTYRFVLVPETIGSIAYLSKRSQHLISNVVCGFNLSCCGDTNRYTHLQSPTGVTLADRALKAALIGKNNVVTKSFLSRGSDERQYCSPNVDLPLCGFSRSKYGDYIEYHTSLDDLEFISEEGLEESFQVIRSIIDSFELGLYPRLLTMGEPQLGKRGLYSNTSFCHANTNRDIVNTRMDIMAYCNGKRTIFDIAELTDTPLQIVIEQLRLLTDHNLVAAGDVNSERA